MNPAAVGETAKARAQPPTHNRKLVQDRRGFADRSCLNRVFKRLMGVPPARCRKQLRAAKRG
jgi:AraC-like DNA-binding protein